MNTFTYRDLRRQRIAAALATLQDAPAELRETLEREQTALQMDSWTVADRTYLAVGEDWLWGARLLLKNSVDADPVLTALGTTALLSDEQAAAIENIPHGPGYPPTDYLTQVQAIIGNDANIFTELLHAAHQAWLSQSVSDRPYPFDDVGVLLPLRLETLFDAPQSRDNNDPNRWKLSMRVVPDEASICRDNPHVSPGELLALQTFWQSTWQSVGQPGDFNADWLEGDRAAVAWEILCHQVTPPRAAWLAATLLPQIDGDQIRVEQPPDMPATPQANRVGGLPTQLQVWAVTRDVNNLETRHSIGRLPMDENTTIHADVLSLSLPDTPDNSRSNWLTSWVTAKAVGMGGEWLLDNGLSPETLAAIYVVGMGDDSPDAHFRAQSDAGEMGVLRLGTPTNAINSSPAADLATDAGGWRRVARARIQQRLNPNNNAASSSGINIERHLTGAIGNLPFFPGADAPDDTQDSQRMAQALWTALLGHWLTDIWEVQDDAFRVSRWAFPLRDDAIPSLDEIRKVLHRPCEDKADLPLLPNFCPEGPLMPLRIAEQPYGLLPVTALSQWRTGDAFLPEQRQQQRIEMAMAQSLSRLRSTWAIAARRNGTTVGKSTAQFMELLSRDAVTCRYIERAFASSAIWAVPYQFDPNGRDRFEELARSLYEGAARLFGRMPQTLYLTNGCWRNNDLPLVQPDQMIYRHRNQQVRSPVSLTRFLALLLDTPSQFPGIDLDLERIFGGWWVLDETGEYKLSVLPNSLLMRLMVYTCQLIAHWQRNPMGGDIAPAVVKAQCEAMRVIGCELDQPDWNRVERDLETGEPIFLLQIPDQRRNQLERALRATLDSAAHRIDPWITGFAWQRLQQHSSSPRHAHRMGVYGWVDGPFLGTPGPTDAGRLHTPSYNQTLAAIILRDKFLSSARSNRVGENANNPWAMNLSSSKVRLAEEIADEVRLGFHFYEVVGRQVEHIVGNHQQVNALRTHPLYAMRSERRDRNEVCNGIEALKGLLSNNPPFPLTTSQIEALQLLQAALDAYSDLLMADGVMQLVNRQTDRAAETMDAAASFSRPPNLEFIRTPPSGYHLESLVVGVVPYVSVNAIAADANPIRLAEPSLAAFVEEKLGNDWLWTAVNQDNNTPVGTIALSAMGLTPLDSLSLSVEFLSELARRSLQLPLVYINEAHNREWTVKAANGDVLGVVSLLDLRLLPDQLAALDEVVLGDRIRTQLAAPPDSTIEERLPDDLRLWMAIDEQGHLLGLATVATLGLTPEEISSLPTAALHQRIRQTLGLAQLRIDSPRQHQLAQQLMTALGNRPAAGRDVTPDRTIQQTVDAEIYTELVDRYTALYNAGQTLMNELRAAADDAQRINLLRRTLGWGITAISEPADRETLLAVLSGQIPPATARSLTELVEITATALQNRLAASPALADLVPSAQITAPLADHAERKRNQKPDGIPTLAQAIANLAVPQGKLTILSCWFQATLLENTHLETQQTEASLDETWLTVVASVRQPLARLEALQLELDAPLTAWSSSPGDPWHTGVNQTVQQNLSKREAGSVLQMSLGDRFVAAYGSSTAWAGEKVAVGMMDAFSEAIPMPQRKTTVGFGFNAPAARPPQAILLAVPPQPRQRLDDDLVLQIVTETRELCHARTAHVEDLGELQTITPTLWLQSSGANQVRLEPYPLFT